MVIVLVEHGLQQVKTLSYKIGVAQIVTLKPNGLKYSH